MPATIRNYLSWRRMAYNVILNAARSNFARYFSQNFSSLGRTVFGKDSYMNYFQGALTPDKIVYIDKKQGQKLERLAERQLFGNYSSLDPNCIIHQTQGIYKLNEMESIDRARSLTNKILETRDSCESLANQRNVVEHDSHEERI